MALADAVRLVAIGVAVTAVLVAVRALWVFGMLFLLPPHGDRSRRVAEATVLSWAGMRGAVSLAAALALPVALPDGRPLPAREALLIVTLTVIVLTLVGQGLTLPWLIRTLRLGGDVEIREEESTARQELIDAAARRIDELYPVWPGHHPLLDRLRAIYQHRSEHVGRSRAATSGEDQEVIEHREIGRTVIGAERETLLRLRAEGAIDDDVLRKLERELDIEEQGLRRVSLALPLPRGRAALGDGEEASRLGSPDGSRMAGRHDHRQRIARPLSRRERDFASSGATPRQARRLARVARARTTSLSSRRPAASRALWEDRDALVDRKARPGLPPEVARVLDDFVEPSREGLVPIPTPPCCTDSAAQGALLADLGRDGYPWSSTASPPGLEARGWPQTWLLRRSGRGAPLRHVPPVPCRWRGPPRPSPTSSPTRRGAGALCMAPIRSPRSPRYTPWWR